MGFLRNLGWIASSVAEPLSSRERETSHPCKEERSVFRCCEGNLNFATIATSEDDEYSNYQKKKVSRDPMSHRIIEKRRRDRMNNCLADLSRLIPSDYLKKGRGRIEKTEIIEMAIKHMKHLQAHACHQSETCELAQQQNSEDSPDQHQNGGPIVIEHYRLGYQECLSEAMHFLVEVEGFFAGDPLCVQLINHLQKHCDKILKGDRLNFPRTHNGETASTSSNSSGGGGYHNRNGNMVPSGSSGLSGSPTSGSCSDTGRSEVKDSGMNNNIPQTRNQRVATIPPAEIEDGCYEEGLVNLSSPSQLREMLTSSNLTTLQTSDSTTLMTRIPPSTFGTISQHLQLPQSPVPSLTNTQYSSGANLEQTCGSGSVASLYKFKNNIKQRFTAEHHPEDSGAMNPAFPGSDNMVNGKRKRYLTVAVQDFGSGKNMATLSTMRRDSETCSIPSSPASPPATSKYPPPSPSPDIAHSPPLPAPIKSSLNPSYGVPIFALHAKGSFYIPLTLESDILAPYLAAVGFGFDANGLQNGNTESVVLHPVTISVNFQQTNHQRLNNQQPVRQHPNQCSTMSTWKNELNGFVPISRWPVYSPDRN